MALRDPSRGGREADAEVPTQPPPGPSLLSLPDIAHYTIASLLPDSYSGRLHLSEISRSMLVHYGGTLTQLSIYRGDGNAARLAALLQRNKKLANVALYHQGGFPALCQAISQGCCRGVETLELVGRKCIMTQERMNMLTGALEVDGALAKLVTLDVDNTFSPGSLPTLATSLAGGAAPLLRRFHFNARNCTEEDMGSIADMVEARVRIPACPGFECISFKIDNLFTQTTLWTQIRLLRALLPSVKELPSFTWHPAFGPLFIEIKPQYLTRIEVGFWNISSETGTFSWEVLAAAPAIETIALIHLFEEGTLHASGAPVMQCMIEALQTGALQRLKEVELGNWILGDDDLTGFTNALEESGCAMQVVDLTFRGCEFGAEGVNILADRLRWDAYSALKTLHIAASPNIMDVGVVALAEALLEARQTSLTELILYDVGMGNEGIYALASLVSQGRINEMEWLDISKNDAVTQQGIIALARAIDARGLTLLTYFSMMKIDGMTAVGISAITHSLIKGCPKLQQIDLTGSVSDDDRHCDWVAGMLESAGRVNEVNVIYEDEDEVRVG